MNLIKFYRIKDWLKLLGIPVIGVLLYSLSFEIITKVIIQVTLSLFYVFSLNDFFDFKFMKEKNYVGKVTNSKGTKVTILLIILPLILSLIMSFFISEFNFLVTISLIILFTIYSSPPLRLKSRWFFSLLINSIGLGGLLFLIGFFSVSSEITLKIIMFFIIFSSFMLSSELIHQLDHMKKDKKNGIQSFPNMFGIKKTLMLFQFIQAITIMPLFITIVLNVKQNVIFFGTILFSLLRIRIIRTLDVKKTDFSILRNRLYGFYEGLFYVFAILFSYLIF